MKSTKEQVLDFLDKCDELTKCKFIMATTKIKDLLKCIVNSPDLYALFEKVTRDFNYNEQKSKCLVSSSAAFTGKVVLPQTVGQRLAFIFCLLVEIDRETVKLDDFLQVYFREDGSYFESYNSFCRTIIVGLADLVRQVFKEQLQSVNEYDAKNDLVFSILNLIEEEKRHVMEVAPDVECEGAIKMLDELASAIKSGNEQLIDALLFGYNYFLLFNKCVGDGFPSLIDLIAEYERQL